MSEDYGNTLGFADVETPNLPRAKRAPRVYSVVELRDTVTGRYFALNVANTSGDPIVVKHSTRYNTVVCLRCVTADRCEHSAAVREWLDDQAKVAA